MTCNPNRETDGIIILFSQVFHGSFPLEPVVNPIIQASSSTFLIMCDVASTAVFCRESVECFPGIFSRFFLVI
jgi:hypothetical protein